LNKQPDGPLIAEDQAICALQVSIKAALFPRLLEPVLQLSHTKTQSVDYYHFKAITYAQDASCVRAAAEAIKCEGAVKATD
jgi:hypothetical protein